MQMYSLKGRNDMVAEKRTTIKEKNIALFIMVFPGQLCDGYDTTKTQRWYVVETLLSEVVFFF